MGIARAIGKRVAGLLAGFGLALAAQPALGEPQGRFPGLDAVCTPPADAPASGSSDPYRPASDWAYLCYYHRDNTALMMQGERPEVVFMGDSITRNWITIDPAFFGPGRVDRGISGQTSAQMLLRFGPDAVALAPKVIHLMAGTNDIAGNPGALAIEAYKANITAMADIARANSITLVIGAIPPADRFPWRPALTPAEDVRMLNAWLREFAAARRLAFIDYHAALATPAGAARDGLTRDGVHPVAEGYRIMADLANPVLAKAVARARRKAQRPK